MLEESVDSTLVKCLIKVGDKVSFIDPKILEGRERKIQEDMVKVWPAYLGPAPYEVMGIVKWANGNVRLMIKGEKGETEISKDYFMK